ncbi:MAG: DUF748 domain-containing protein [Deltaproteobacteria bacterium]|nr:DUF748 domain-containing protein [Deltaproteobacteria bacterium]
MNVKTLAGRPFFRKLLPWFAVCSTVIVVAGFLILPRVLKSVLTRQLSEKLHRETSIGEIQFNPFTLAVKVTGFSMKERGGAGPFLSFEELYLNFEASSIFRGGPVLRDIVITAPSVTVIRKDDLSYNFSDLLDEFVSKPSTVSKPLRYSLNNIQVVGGIVDFDDRPKRTRHAIRDIRIAVPFFSNLPYYVDVYVQPVFLAKVNGTPVDLRGKTKPFSGTRETAFDVNFRNLNIPHYLEYLPVKWKFRVASAFLDADADLSFREHKDKPPVLSFTGKAALRDLKIEDAKGKAVLRMPLLKVSVAASDVFGRKASLDSVLFRSPELQLERERSGALNLVSLLEPQEMTEGTVKTAEKAEETVKEGDAGAPLLIEIAEIRLEGGKVGFADELPKRPFRATLDSIDLSFRCRYARGMDDDGATLTGISASLGTLKLRTRGESDDFLKIPAITVKSADADLGKRTLAIGEITTRGGVIRVERDPDGSSNMEALSPAPAPAAHGRDPRPAKDKAEAPPEWLVTIGKAAVERYSVKVEDRTVSPPAVLYAEPIALTAENLSTGKGVMGKASLQVVLNRAGTFAAAGPVGLNPFSANLQVDARGIGIVPFQPYFTEKVRIVVSGGNVSARGTLALVSAPDKAIAIAYRGEASLTDLATADKSTSEDFLKWKSLHLGGINARTRPLRVEIDEIALADFYSRIAVNPDGTLNVLEAFVSGTKTAAPGATGAGTYKAAVPATPGAPEPAKPPHVRIGTVTVQGGTVRFSDRFVKPNYIARLGEMGGRISGLSSEENKFADVDLRGNLENHAPLQITGKINPLRDDLFVDLKADFKDIELSPLTPYSGKYAGYAIEKGKLTLALKYLITKRTLDASNHVFLDQFTFGSAVDSPDSTKLPVKLAVALLKDRRGEINLDIPVNGSLDDPKFSVGSIILKIVLNLLAKAATSPFSLLGAIFGGGEELSHLEFEYGRSDMNASMAERVNVLEKVLYDRPGLKLEIAGHVDAGRDRDGLLRTVFDRKVKAQKSAELAKTGTPPSSLDNVTVGEAEYPRYLELAYRKEKFPKPRNIIGMAKDLPASEMEKLMLTNIRITDDDLRQLAMRRARRVRDALLKGGRVAPERMFLVEPKALSPEKKEKLKDSRVDFVLK